MLTLAIILSALFVGWNIGANDAANAIGTVIGSNATGYRWAVLLVGFFAIVGAIMQGSNVAETVRSIVPEEHLEANTLAVLSAMTAAGVVILGMTLLGMPISGSQAIIGALAGAGIALGLWDEIEYVIILKILVCWILSPLAACALAILVYTKLITPLFNRMNVITFTQIFKILALLGASLLAYDLGANNIGNALGPVLSAKALDTTVFFGFTLQPMVFGALIIGLSIGAGAIMFGRNVAVTLGKKITTIGPATAFSAQLAAGVTVYSFVVLGIPVSTTQAIVGGVIGVGLTKGVQTVNTETLKNIMFGWFITPIMSCIASVVVYLICVRVLPLL